MGKWTGFLMIVFVPLRVFGESYLLNGGLASQINYTMEQVIVPAPGVQEVDISYVVPTTFTSPSYKQRIEDFHVQFSVRPSSTTGYIDDRGNEIKRIFWRGPEGPIKMTMTMNAINSTDLKTLETRAPFPVEDLPPDAEVYLAATAQVPSDLPAIVKKAEQLTASSETEFDAVQKILVWIVDRMNYELRPKSFDALYSLRTGMGNCQNYSHVAAVFMRAAGIPVRIVNGLTLDEPYDIEVSGGILTMRMAKGRHSWIEVYFPDLDWVPFDPQQTQMFVSNRYIRVEVGLDNEETVNDGCVRWRQPRDVAGETRFRESIAAEFVSDRFSLTGQKQPVGPQKLLFSPPVETYFSQGFFEEGSTFLEFAPAEKAAAVSSESDQILMGNLDFPQGVDFFEDRTPVRGDGDSVVVMRKSFLVETAEYVTGSGQKYAQTFILKNPMRLDRVGLALHKFGGDGQLWIELFKDDGSGKPDQALATSEILRLDGIKFSPGYSWVDFDFSKEAVTLTPGRYWIALGYTGSPIVNWFFTYGKPVGPSDGTRYNTLFDQTWSRSLTYEFNYRVIGKKAK